MSTREAIVVVQKGDHSLGYYDFETGAELDRVKIDPFPHEFALSPDENLAYMAHFGVALAEDEGPGGSTVSVVDIHARRRVGTIDCKTHRRPHDVAFDAKGMLYILSEGTGNLLVLSHPASGRIDHVISTGGEGSHKVTVLHDGSMAFCSNMNSDTVGVVFPKDPKRPAVIIPVGKRPEGSVLDAEERRLFIVSREGAEIGVIDVKRLAVIDSIPTPRGPVRICRDPRGRLLVALYYDCGMSIIDPNSGAQQVIPLPDKPISIGFHAPTHTAMLSTHAHRICLVDTRAGRLARFVPTRSDPDPMAVVSLSA
jgi:DNA-binding beta-propeller fold protein YncE